MFKVRYLKVLHPDAVWFQTKPAEVAEPNMRPRKGRRKEACGAENFFTLFIFRRLYNQLIWSHNSID